ncbi:uncharacterized protein METZ01_LOCUS203520, partial [marine metagenome]
KSSDIYIEDEKSRNLPIYRACSSSGVAISRVK